LPGGTRFFFLCTRPALFLIRDPGTFSPRAHTLPLGPLGDRTVFFFLCALLAWTQFTSSCPFLRLFFQLRGLTTPPRKNPVTLLTAYSYSHIPFFKKPHPPLFFFAPPFWVGGHPGSFFPQPKNPPPPPPLPGRILLFSIYRFPFTLSRLFLRNRPPPVKSLGPTIG